MNAGQWALVAVVIWMAGTMVLGAVGALVVLRITRTTRANPPDPGPHWAAMARVVPASRTRAPSNPLPGWRPPPGV